MDQLTEPTKSDVIRELYEDGWTVRQIADALNVMPEYVRVVARQRPKPGMTPERPEPKYKMTEEQRRRKNVYMREYRYYRYHADPEFRKRVQANDKASAARRRARAKVVREAAE